MSRRYKQDYDIFQKIIIGAAKLFWFLITLPFKGKGKKISNEEIQNLTRKRLEIEKMLESDNEYELHHALLEADKLVDHTLKIRGYQGETFADRLRSAENFIEKNVYQAIWDGHKTRNIIAHEHDMKISNEELKGAVLKLLKYLK